MTKPKPIHTDPPQPPIEVKLHGGPMHGRVVLVPRGTERLDIGPLPRPFVVYTYAGKIEGRVQFAKRPKSRLGRRILMSIIGATGRDPRIEREDRPK